DGGGPTYGNTHEGTLIRMKERSLSSLGQYVVLMTWAGWVRLQGVRWPLVRLERSGRLARLDSFGR
ncbi:MAG TPA: hypothetical protein VF468_04225, partial [Actinomycetota bacterium]|nr:hypothetical protein [Actinomycetota bacterium]